ncbi:molybdopterin molybdotransferase MoeA [Paenarthrobacter sp. NPDC089322]|uniref:molybdopterin molybdotransferase MoeA n=1 Tax=Paenarthrobacter sp. NPDC089322 TaxID=3155065 RepID=UPI003432C326
MLAQEVTDVPTFHMSCGKDHAPTWSEARHVAYHCARPLGSVSVPLAEGIGRALTSDVIARQAIPHYASSAMDGWAFNGSAPWILKGTAIPGKALSAAATALAPGEASIIATGGLVPEGAAGILRKESGLVTADASGTRYLAPNPDAKAGEELPGRHIRPAGEEASAGDVLIPAGTLLNPAHIALAAVAGHDQVSVQRKPVVAVVLTGSEVVTAGEPAPGQVRDTFGPQLATVISQLGGVPSGQRRIGDSYQEWITALAGPHGDRPGPPSDRRADVTITTGGTGKSGTDHFRRAVDALGGRLVLDGIAMRPGHPAVLAELPDGRFVIGLPGNPLAAMIALLTIGEPLLAALGNRSVPATGVLTSGADFEPDPGRTRLVPCTFVHGLAVPASHTGPGMMRGLAWADGVMAVPPEGVEAGEAVPVMALPWTTPG